MPRVSVVIPTYNSSDLVVQAVASVLAQSYADYEIIVVDDGSTDNTRNVLAPYADRIRYVWQENQERSAARNRGIRLACGELVAFLDADDVWLSGHLEQHVTALDDNPEAVLAYSSVQFIDTDGLPTKYHGHPHLGAVGGQTVVQSAYPRLCFGCAMFTCGVVVRRSAFDRAGLFDTHLNLGEDWEMWIRLARQGAFVYVPRVLSQYRVENWHAQEEKRARDDLVAQYTYVIEKTAATDGGVTLASLWDEALAQCYALSGLASYRLGDVERGQKMWRLASRTCPKRAERLPVTFLLEDHARRVVRETDDKNRALRFLRTTIANLPPGVQTPRHGARGVLSRVHMGDAFRAYRDGDRNKALRALYSGVRNDPTWLLNLGVLSIAVRSLLRSTRTPER